MPLPCINFLFSFTIFLCCISSYTQQKIYSHFSQIDTNKNNLIQKTQYISQLKKQDIDAQIVEGQQYYDELVGLLFQMYDEDSDQTISLNQWVGFAKDIEDDRLNQDRAGQNQDYNRQRPQEYQDQQEVF